MGETRIRVSHRSLWFHAKGTRYRERSATDARHRQREPGMDLDERRPQAPGVEAGITGP